MRRIAVNKKTKAVGTALIVATSLAVLGGMPLAQQDKYTLKVPGGLAFSEFRGYEGWPGCCYQSE